MSLLDIRDDPNYINANAATKQAIFDEYSKDDQDYLTANQATKDAIRQEFGLSVGTTTVEPSTGIGVPQAATVGAQVAEQLAPAVGGVAKDVGKAAYTVGKGSVQDIGAMARVATQVTPAAAGDLFKQMLTSPVKTGSELIGAYVQGHPYLGKATQSSLSSVGRDALQYAKNIGSSLPSMRQLGSGIVQGAVAPESLFAAPYQMAAYEQEKIRANPTAPEYATNPYAQMYRGEAPTQGAAGAMNRRNAIAGQQYGGLTQQEQDILEQDRINRAIRRKAAEKVLGPVAPRGM
jgi:hypothetical protein